MEPAQAARFPHVADARGHYESFYLRAVDPHRPRGAWIRYTTHKRPGRATTGSLWCTISDAESGRPPYGVKQTWGDDGGEDAGGGAPEAPPDAWIAIGGARFGPDRAAGRAEGRAHSAAWDLRIASRAGALRHLPRAWMYRAPLPRTKLESPIPDATIAGEVRAGDRPPLALDGWRGMAGHNWGAEHAATWIWLHGVAFAEDTDAWLDLSIGRVKLGPVLTPWIANGAVHIRGATTRLGGPRPARVHATPHGCRITLAGLTVEARSPDGQTVAWPYADPRGGEHHSLNCSIARLTVTLGDHEMTTPHGGVYELGTAPGGHGIEPQPFPDG